VAEIVLTQGQVALVDDDDYEWINGYKWTAMRAHRGRKFVAARSVQIEAGKQRLVYMSRQILGLNYGDSGEADHWNHDTLDNRRENLRLVSSALNKRNQPSRGGSSRFVGVTWDGQRGRWRAQIQIDGRVINLGRFASEEEAAEARDYYVMANSTGHALNLARTSG
jgi:hypothetical protein